MRKWCLAASLLVVSLVVGCGQSEVKPTADTKPADTAVADKAMADMANNPNVPAAMKEKMKNYGPKK